MSFLSKIPTVAKAITAGVGAFASTVATANLDNVVTQAEWITVAVATVLAAVAVFLVPNKSDATEEVDPL